MIENEIFINPLEVMISHNTYKIEIAPGEFVDLKEVITDNVNLKRENKKLKDKLNCDLEWSFKYDELKERIDKAIETLEQFDDDLSNYVIEILKGEDN